MQNYLDLIQRVMDEGIERKTRNAVTKSIFGVFMEWDLSDGFPLLTTKQMKLKSIASELAWILEGSRDEGRLRELNQSKTSIWTANADAYHGEFPGDVGHIYGPLLRDFHGVDQLTQIVKTLVTNPMDRRMIVTMHDPSAKDKQCLPTCHYAWQVYVRDGKYLDIMWHQRSVDVGLGLPYDIAHYAILNHLLARTVDLLPGKVYCSLGDTHIYENHYDALSRQVERKPKKLPDLLLDSYATVFDFEPEMLELINYQSHPALPMEMSV